LRIGDVIKSNYSRFNLSRLFGAGNPAAGALINTTGDAKAVKAIENLRTKVSKVDKLAKSNIWSNGFLTPLLAFIASPAEVLAVDAIQQGSAAAFKSIASDVVDLSLKNGFVNPLLPGLLSSKSIIGAGSTADTISNYLNLSTGGKFLLKPRAEPYVFIKDSKKAFVKLTRPLEIKVEKSIENPTQSKTPGDSKGSQPYQVAISIPDFTLAQIPESFIKGDIDILTSGGTCEVTLDQCLLDPDSYFSATLLGLMLVGQASLTSLITQPVSAGAASLASKNLVASTGATLSTNLISDLLGSYMRQFTSPLENPITFAMEDSMSRGLAGVVTSIQFNWLEGIPWETSWNSRAPTACKITMAFDPLHDIAPGLDSYGANRAPVYNVGNTRLVAGDPLPDNGVKSQYYYNRSGKEISIADVGVKKVVAAFNNR
jgi:hypothetical protein